MLFKKKNTQLKKFKYSSIIFSNLKLSKFLFYSPPKLLFQIVTLKSTIKFSPSRQDNNSFSSKKNFFINSIELKKFLNLYSNNTVFLKSFNFFSLKKNKIKFRKRKNLLFNISYATKLNNIFFFEIIKNLIFYKQVFSQITKNYNLKAGVLKVKESKNSLEIYILNLHYLLSFINNLTFKKKDYIFILRFDLSKDKSNFFSLLLKEIFFKKLINETS
ncbi:MAG: hypothetical protein KDH96_04835 [Candidatus Riesia sp.]|nr:hypothetical protein [Candidatus Riesia sp.]